MAHQRRAVTPGRATAALSLVALLALAVSLLAPLRGGIPGVMASTARAKLVQKGFEFLEGPVGTPDGGLYFTDLFASRIYRLDPNGGISVVREPSGHANGLALTSDGGLLAAERANQRLSKWSSGSAVTIISDNAGGNRYVAPNDLFADARGGIYFTDPGDFSEHSDRTTYVYYLPPGQTEALAIDDQITRPNGIILTPDGKTLIVSDTQGEAVFAYDVQSDGTVKDKRIFTKLRNIPAGKASGADGMAVDREGRLYVTTMTGVQVFDAKGSYLGTIDVPHKPSNVAFSGPDKSTLYITARKWLYRVNMLAQGPDRPGK